VCSARGLGLRAVHDLGAVLGRVHNAAEAFDPPRGFEPGNLADFPSFRAQSGAFLAGYRSVRPLARRLEAHLPVLMAARHVVACAWVVGVQGMSADAPPVAEHVAIRVEQIRHCLRIRP
jgi:Ser/Thr protein kinase RdoA (MazF antagonist)